MSENADYVLETRGLTKEFKGFIAVKNVNLQVKRGTIHALIGPNGAGKTTFFNVIAGLSDPTSGAIEFLGQRMVARPVRAWAEPLFWFALPVPTAIVAALLLNAGITAIGELVLLAAHRARANIQGREVRHSGRGRHGLRRR